VTETILTRPVPAADAGPLDERFWDLVEARFRRLVETNPQMATYVGIHSYDDRLPDGSRDAVVGEIGAERTHLAAVEALDAMALSPSIRFERELEVHNVRRALFDLDVHRVWERRSSALDAVGDALFSLFARDFAPLPERLASITARMEGIPALLEQHKSRATAPQVRLWQELEIESGEQMPFLFNEIRAAGGGVLDEKAQARLDKAVIKASEATAEYVEYLKDGMGRTIESWALGRDA
jgi:hypothetical protein